jgi:putative transposase
VISVSLPVALYHSDRGSQYTSEQFQPLIADHRVVCSISRSGKVWDSDGELLIVVEDRANCAQNLPNERRRQSRCVRLYSALYNPKRRYSTIGNYESYEVREEG